MTDYEIVDLMQSHVTSVGEIGTYLVTGLFAFIITCYITSRKLNTVAFAGLLAVYIPYAIIQLLGLYTNLGRLKGILIEAASRESLTKEVQIFTESTMTATDNIVSFMMSYFILAVIASIIFGFLIKSGKLDL